VRRRDSLLIDGSISIGAIPLIFVVANAADVQVSSTQFRLIPQTLTKRIALEGHGSDTDSPHRSAASLTGSRPGVARRRAFTATEPYGGALM
jgi:hypothetical protein